jgi:MFS family permease
MEKYRANIRKIYIFEFLFGLHFIGGVLVPFYLDWGKVSYTQIMILQSFFVIFAFLLEIPTGAVADHLGRKTSLALSAITGTIAPIVYASAPNFYIFVLGEFFFALAVAFLSGSDVALTYDSLKEMGLEKEFKKIIGRFKSFQIAGLVIAAPIGSLIASKIGLRYSMMFLCFPHFIALFIAITFKEPKIRSDEEIKPRYIETVKSGIGYFKGHRILKILAFDLVSISAFVFFIIWMYQPLLGKLGVPIIYFGLVHALLSGIQVPVMNSFDKLEKIFGSKSRFLLFSALLPGMCFILLGISTNITLVIILIALTAAFGMSRGILFRNYMNKYIESHNRATVNSTVSMIYGFISAILYPLVGIMVEWSLNYSFIIIGTLTIICALFSKVEEEHLID